MLKYLFLGSPPIAKEILRILCDKGLPPQAVVTQVAKAAGRGKHLQSTAVELFAREKGLEVIATENVNDEAVLTRLRGFSPDLLLVAAFGQIFREPLLRLAKLYALNVHASLLPKYRGAGPVQWSILNGDAITGVSIQKMVKQLDAGDVLVQKTIPIEPDDTTETLLTKLGPLGGEALWESLQLIEAGTAQFTAQDPALVSFAPKIEKQDAIIDWTRPASRILNQVRAYQPWPIAETKLGGVRLKIFRAAVTAAKTGGVPGTLTSDAKTFLSVQCGEGTALALTEIQLENRKRLEVIEFLNAYRGSFPFTSVG